MKPLSSITHVSAATETGVSPIISIIDLKSCGTGTAGIANPAESIIGFRFVLFFVVSIVEESPCLIGAGAGDSEANTVEL
jgi:hypothetical protein